MVIQDAILIEENDLHADVEIKKEQHIITIVFVAIIWGTLKDIFRNTIGVLWKFIKHLAFCFLYFWSPDIDRPPFDKFNFKTFCKVSFESVLLVLFISVFMVKADWIPANNDLLKKDMSSEIFQISYELKLFVLFAITYFIIILLTIASGRVIRNWLTPTVSKRESDILMITLFNSFFSLTALAALIIRINVNFNDNDLETILSGVIIILFLSCFVLTTIWAIRFIYLNKVQSWKKILFFFTALIFYTIVFTIGGSVTTGLLYLV